MRRVASTRLRHSGERRFRLCRKPYGAGLKENGIREGRWPSSTVALRLPSMGELFAPPYPLPRLGRELGSTFIKFATFNSGELPSYWEVGQ
jgi:hypothetical protein